MLPPNHCNREQGVILNKASQATAIRIALAYMICTIASPAYAWIMCHATVQSVYANGAIEPDSVSIGHFSPDNPDISPSLHTIDNNTFMSVANVFCNNYPGNQVCTKMRIRYWITGSDYGYPNGYFQHPIGTHDYLPKPVTVSQYEALKLPTKLRRLCRMKSLYSQFDNYPSQVIASPMIGIDP
jgi:hypothetical protein